MEVAEGRNLPKYDGPTGLRAMLESDQPEMTDGEAVPAGEAGLGGETEPTGTALVPLAATTQWAPKIPLPHADPSFVAHLIATAAHAPQTRGQQRGSLADAQTAYGPHPNERRSVTRRTQQII